MRNRIAASFACVAMLASAAPAAAQQAACTPLTWTTLGTAGGPMPTFDRAEPSNLLRAGNRYILIDTGDGTVNQLAKVGLNLGRIDAVFISHHHMDHTGGLAAVIGLRWMNNFPNVLTVYGPPGTRELVDGIVASMQPQARVGFGLGTKSAPPSGSVKAVELGDGGKAQLGAMAVTAAANSHFDHHGAKGPVALSLSYRFAYEGRSIAYSGDTGPSEAFARLATGSDMLVTEIMDYDPLIKEIARQRPDMPPNIREQMQKHLFTHHLTADEVGKLAKSARPGQVLLTHYAMPPGARSNTAVALLDGIRAHYPGPVHFGRDLASFDVGCR